MTEAKMIGSGLDDIQYEDPASRKGSATAEGVREAMGNQLPKLPRIEVKHQGTALFKEKNGAKRSFEKLTGVIVAFTKHNSFFGKKFEERTQGERPKCYSNDGLTVSKNAPEPQAPGCGGCFRNRDAERGSEARKKAFELDRKTENCNNYLTLVMILKGGGEIPFAVQFPNTSFGPWAAFVQELYSRGRFNPHEVVAEITLIDKQQRGGSAHFSEAAFKMLGVIPEAMAPAYVQQHESWGAYLARNESGADGGADNAGTAADAVKRAKAAEDAVKSGEQQAAI